MELSLAELAERLGVRLAGDGAVRIRGVAGLREAGPGQISFLSNPKYAALVTQTQASALILPESFPSPGIPALYAAEPYLAFVEALEIFDESLPETVPAGIAPSAVVDPSARIDPSAAIGPFVFVGARASIGPGTRIMAGAYIGPEVRIGAGCVLYPRVVLRRQTELGERVIVHAGAVLGDDGFGFAPDGGGYRKIPQLGRVVVEDDVEVGANTTIDRATTGVTRIGRGTKIDNLVMIAHNVEIGEDSIVCGQVGLSGSVRAGRHVVLGGQAGFVGHITIGDGARVGAQSGVTRSIPAGESWSGYPAQAHRSASRAYAALRGLPEALKEIRRLEARIEALEQRPAERLPAGRDEESSTP